MTFLPNLPPGNTGQMFQPAEMAGHFDIDDVNWTRPSEWLTFTKPDGVPEKIIGLIAIYPNTEGGAVRNYVAFNFDTNDASTYQINWGNGTTNTYNSNTTYHYVYDYDAITSDTSTQKATLFRGYKQAVFEVILQSGKTFDADGINFSVDGPYVSHASVTTRAGPSILDLFVSSSVTTSVNINLDRPMRELEQLEIRNTSSNRITTPQRLYAGCRSLESIPFVPWIYNSGTRDYLRAFRSCAHLKILPDEFASQDKYWFKNPNRMQECFYRCFALRQLPEGLFGDSTLTNCSNFQSMFYECRNLRYIPYIGVRTNASANVKYMFYNNAQLKAIPKGFSLVQSNGLLSVFTRLRECYDWSVLSFPDGDDSPAIGPLDTIVTTSNYDGQAMFTGQSHIRQIPYWGSFGQFTNATNLFSQLTQAEEFHPLYEANGGLDFRNVLDMQQTFYEEFCLSIIPTIHVRSLTNTNALFRTFFRMHSIKRIKLSGMIDGPSNGEYFQCFYDCYTLQRIEGVDFSYANDSGDYSGLFSQTRNLTSIRFPGELREGNTRLNVTISNYADVSGEYQINAAGTGYDYTGSGSANLSVSESGGNYTWTLDTGGPTFSSSAASTTQFTPWAADWSGASETFTFAAVETGFKYSVSLQYCPLDREALVIIFNQLVSSGSGTINIKNNVFTADLTADDIAIAENKGYSLDKDY